MKNVLVVDDEMHMTYILAHVLRKAGANVVTAGNGLAGFDAALARKPDLIVTDFQMPECSGIEMAERLRLTPETAQIPLIMVTSRGHRIPDELLARTNIKLIVEKPFSGKELLAKAVELIGSMSDAPVATPQTGSTEPETGTDSIKSAA